jgi:hypothetical protein
MLAQASILPQAENIEKFQMEMFLVPQLSMQVTECRRFWWEIFLVVQMKVRQRPVHQADASSIDLHSTKNELLNNKIHYIFIKLARIRNHKHHQYSQSFEYVIDVMFKLSNDQEFIFLIYISLFKLSKRLSGKLAIINDIGIAYKSFLAFS